jgi:hypothetical protein
MPGLNVHADSENSSVATKKKWNRGPKVILAVSLLLLIPVVGTSLASNVVVNSGGPITFGQGYVAAIDCSNNVTISPNAKFHYNAGTSYWYVDQITISGIDTSAGGCAGKTITVRAMHDGDSAKKIDNVAADDVSFTLPLSSTPVTCNSGIKEQCFSSGYTTLDTLTIPLIADIQAADVNGFTIQES